MTLPVAQRKLLQALQDAETSNDPDADFEVVCEGLLCYQSHTRVSLATVNSLLRLCAITEEASDGSFHRYTINETGRNLLRDETQIAPLLKAIHTGGAYTWKQGKIIPMNQRTTKAIR